MNATPTATMPLNSQSYMSTARPLATSVESIWTGLDAETRELLSVLGRTLYLLGLGTIGVVAVTGQPPLFFIPLALFLLFGSSMQWRQFASTRDRAAADRTETGAVSSARHEPFCGYEDKA